MATLYEMTQAATELYMLLGEEEIDEQTFNDTLEAIGAPDKVESYCQIIRQLEADRKTSCDAQIAVLGEEIARLKGRADEYNRKIDRMKSALHDFICACGGEKQKGKTFTAYLQTTKAADIVDESSVPDVYKIMTYRIDKKAILDDLKSGIEIPGAAIKETEGVRIR